MNICKKSKKVREKTRRFQDKMHRKACYNLCQGKTWYQTEFNSFVFYLHCFIIRSCDLNKGLFLQSVTKFSFLSKCAATSIFRPVSSTPPPPPPPSTSAKLWDAPQYVDIDRVVVSAETPWKKTGTKKRDQSLITQGIK